MDKDQKQNVWMFTGKTVKENNNLGIPVEKALFIIAPPNDTQNLTLAFAVSAAARNNIVHRFSLAQIDENIGKIEGRPEHAEKLAHLKRAKEKLEAHSAPTQRSGQLKQGQNRQQSLSAP